MDFTLLAYGLIPIAIAGVNILLGKVWMIESDLDYDAAVKSGKTSDFKSIEFKYNVALVLCTLILFFVFYYFIHYLLKIYFHTLFPEKEAIVFYGKGKLMWGGPLVTIGLMSSGLILEVFLKSILKSRYSLFKRFQSLKQGYDVLKINSIAVAACCTVFLVWSFCIITNYIAIDDKGIHYKIFTKHKEEIIPFNAVEKIGRQTKILGNGTKIYNVKLYIKGNRIINLNMLYEEDDPKSFDPAISFIQKRNFVEVTKEKDIVNK